MFRNTCGQDGADLLSFFVTAFRVYPNSSAPKPRIFLLHNMSRKMCKAVNIVQ